MKSLAHHKTADIGLLLEGTYPYVRGGVSSWVHQIIKGFPEYTFALFFLGSEPDEYGEMLYELPDNVVHMETHFIMPPRKKNKPKEQALNEKILCPFKEMHQSFRENTAPTSDLFAEICAELSDPKGLGEAEFKFSRAAWDMITSYYDDYSEEPSFITYFWAVRFIHQPLFRLSKLVSQFPKVRCLHSISTGYAGFLGALCAERMGVPLVLSEHGIYTKERKIDLAQASWIADPESPFGNSLAIDTSHIRRLWIRFFEALGRLTYLKSSPIISLYEGNRERQVIDGAKASLTRVIPNGIDPLRFANIRDNRSDNPSKIMGLIGRVVPIKDIKTFLRSVHAAARIDPEIVGWIVGPEDEDPEYARECRELVDTLAIGDNIVFKGFCNVADVLSEIGVMVLTSISEALPLVILEAYSAGLPCVVTDVGACRELIEGNTEADKELGAAGSVVQIASPDQIAEAVIDLLHNPEKWSAATESGWKRLNQYYTHDHMFSAYRDVYSEMIS